MKECSLCLYSAGKWVMHIPFFNLCFCTIHQHNDSIVNSLIHSTLQAVSGSLQPKMRPDAPASTCSLTESEAWLRWVVRGRSGSGKREKFVLGPLQRRSVTNWGEGDEWGHSLGLMKEFLLGPEWGWAHLHHIGVHKPVTSKITQEALWDSHPSNRLGCA